MRSNAAEPRPQFKIFGRFQCREALQSVPPFLTYQARAQGLAGFERVFAVKVLPASAASTRPDAGQRLLESANRANAVKDARVGQVVDSGTNPDGSAYVASEFVFGLNLSGLRGGALVETSGQRTATTMLLAHLAAEIAGALAAAHEMRPAVVHGAVSPSNVFLTVRGGVKVIDFGQRMAVMPSRLAGTKRLLSPYAAPELLLSGDGSPEADVFALGSMVFEVATGKTPPSARNPRSATDLSRALSTVPPDLEDVITSLLRVDPIKRPSARDAEAAFRKIALGLSEPELRAHLAGLARKLSTPQGPSPSSAESMVMPRLDPQLEPAVASPERHTAPTARPSAPALVGSDPPQNPDEPLNTLPFADLIASGLQGAAAQTPSPAERPKPNMDNITTKEMDAMFAPGLSAVSDPGATREVPSLIELQTDDALDEAKTSSFSRGMFAKLVGNDAETPVGQPPWIEPDHAPSGFASSEAEGTNEIDDDQLVTSGVYTAAAANVNDAAEVPEYALPPTGIRPSKNADAAEDDAGRASEHMLALSSQDEERDLDLKTAGKRRLYVTLATAAVVALAASVAGGLLLGDSKARVSQNRALPAQEPNSDLQNKAAPAEPDKSAIEPEAAAPDAPLVAPSASRVSAEGGPAPRDIEGRVRLTFKTQPTGAVVWINGGERGRSPVRAELKERHKALVIIKPGFKRIEEDMNHAELTAERTYTLEPIAPPSEGNAFIRVQCEQEGKYPVSIDGIETGLLCPAEVRVTPGEHSVEVFVPWRFKSYANQVTVGARKVRVTKFNK